MPPRPTKRPVKGAKDTLSLEQHTAALAAARPQTPNDIQLASTQQGIQSNVASESKWEGRLVGSKGLAQVTLNKVHRLTVLMQLCRHAVMEIDSQVDDYLAKISNWPVFLPALSVTNAFNAQSPMARGREQLNASAAATVSSSMYGSVTGEGGGAAGAPGRRGGAAGAIRNASQQGMPERKPKRGPSTPTPPVVDASEAMASALAMQFSQDCIVHDLLMVLPSPVTQPSEFTAAVVELMQTGTSSLLQPGTFAGIVSAYVSNSLPVPSTVPGAPNLVEPKARSSARGRRSLSAGASPSSKEGSSSAAANATPTMPATVVAQFLTQAGLGKGATITSDIPLIGPNGTLLSNAAINADPSLNAVIKMRKAQVSALATYLRTCFKTPRMGSKEKAPVRPTTATDFRLELAVGSRIAAPYTDVASLTSAMTNAAQGAPQFPIPNAVGAIKSAAMATAASTEGFEWYDAAGVAHSPGGTAQPNIKEEKSSSSKGGGGKGGGGGGDAKAASPSPSGKRGDKGANAASSSPALSQFLASVEGGGKGSGGSGSKGKVVAPSNPDPAVIDTAMQHLFMLSADYKLNPPTPTTTTNLNASGDQGGGTFGATGDMLDSAFLPVVTPPQPRGGVNDSSNTFAGAPSPTPAAIKKNAPSTAGGNKKGSSGGPPLPPRPPTVGGSPQHQQQQHQSPGDQPADPNATSSPTANPTTLDSAVLLESVMSAKDVPTLLSHSFQFYTLPCPKGLDPEVMNQISSWRSQRLRLEACLRALEDEKVPLLSRVEVASGIHVLGSYSVWAAKRELSMCKQTEAQLLKKRLQEERDFLASQQLNGGGVGGAAGGGGAGPSATGGASDQHSSPSGGGGRGAKGGAPSKK